MLAAAPPPQVPCGPPAAHTLAASADARVYKTDEGDFGCRRGARKPFELSVDTGEEDGNIGAGPIRFAGPFVAYVVRGSGYDGDQDYEFTDGAVTDLRSGKRERAFAGRCQGGDTLRVTDLVVRPTGAFAFVCEHDLITCDRRGPRRLDRSVHVHTLKLDGDTISWSAHHGDHTARLIGKPRGNA